jgi:hypothetical protein
MWFHHTTFGCANRKAEDVIKPTGAFEKKGKKRTSHQQKKPIPPHVCMRRKKEEAQPCAHEKKTNWGVLLTPPVGRAGTRFCAGTAATTTGKNGNGATVCPHLIPSVKETATAMAEQRQRGAHPCYPPAYSPPTRATPACTPSAGDYCASNKVSRQDRVLVNFSLLGVLLMNFELLERAAKAYRAH